jgi:hypothetical protein
MHSSSFFQLSNGKNELTASCFMKKDLLAMSVIKKKSKKTANYLCRNLADYKNLKRRVK